MEVPLRIVLAKIGFDGHDRGLRVVARTLRDAGCEVIYLGLRQSTDNVVTVAEQEDADVIGLSMHNAGHLTLATKMITALRQADLDIPVVVGGIIPEQDMQPLLDSGVAALLGPGASSEEVVRAMQEAASKSPVT